jgi:hypothetical protein
MVKAYLVEDDADNNSSNNRQVRQLELDAQRMREEIASISKEPRHSTKVFVHGPIDCQVNVMLESIPLQVLPVPT